MLDVYAATAAKMDILLQGKITPQMHVFLNAHVAGFRYAYNLYITRQDMEYVESWIGEFLAAFHHLFPVVPASTSILDLVKTWDRIRVQRKMLVNILYSLVRHSFFGPRNSATPFGIKPSEMYQKFFVWHSCEDLARKRLNRIPKLLAIVSRHCAWRVFGDPPIPSQIVYPVLHGLDEHDHTEDTD
ncbi:hypothetical protein BDZ89DRAFT_1141796 [Hymenopellis radicata]|nr:hypothetical protein BDZ89DRAFT_1141796 [Hymenopellis radicata]